MRTTGNYYATATLRRGERRYARDTAKRVGTPLKARNLTEATIAATPEATGRAYIQRWDDRTQRRYLVAERDEAGNWWNCNPYNGTLTAWEV